MLLLLCVSLTSCAYYNTFYLARKNYEKGTGGLPYLPDKPEAVNFPFFNKSIDFSKKVIAQFPKDKLVDDAYLLWAKALLGADDPRQSIKLLEDFPGVFPNSALQPEAKFYLGVANRQARKYGNALRAFDDFLATASKKHELRPYAHLERARVLMSLERPGEAAAAAQEAIERYPKFVLIDRARLARAEALLAQGSFEDARQAFHELGTRATTDADRLKFLLREAECLETGRRYPDELALLNDALAHERPPIPADTSRGQLQAVAGSDAYGQILLRIGTAQLLSGHMDLALDAYRRVALDYPRTAVAAEAQYRVGYAYETVGDDFDKAKLEYQRVREHGGGGSFVDQANNRLANLDRLAQFKTAGGDSAEKKAEAGFLLAELYLFQLDKPERALEQYQKIATEFAGTPMGAKAINAQAWVLSRKLDRKQDADSLFWAVVHEYPKTEAQLAARDYLELEGVSVPENLIQLPEPKYAAVDSTAIDSGVTPQSPIPPTPTALGTTPSVGPPLAGSPIDSLRFGMPPPRTFGMSSPAGVPPFTANPPIASRPAPPPRPTPSQPQPVPPAQAMRDTLVRTQPLRRDSSAVQAPRPAEPVPAPADSSDEPR